jgi:hypothetical protein
VFERVRSELGRYFAALTFSNSILGIGTTLTMAWLDMPNPLLWGVIAFLLNFIPYAGSAITLTLLTVVALVSFDGVGKAVSVAGTYLVLTTLEGQVLQPVLDRCVLISFDLPSVKILRLMTGARIGWVLSQYDAAAQQQAIELAPQFLFANLERLPAEPEPLWAGPWDWALYEVRDLKTARACQERGAKYVETMAVRGLQHAFAEARRQW